MWPILQAKQLQQLSLFTVQLDAEQQLGAKTAKTVHSNGKGSVAGCGSAESCPRSSLPLLTNLQLSYDSSYHLDDSAAAWDALGSRLQDLKVDLARSDPACISQRVLQHLSACSGLTRLEMHNIGHFEATAEELTAMLQQLTGLRRLVLGDGWQWGLRGAACEKVSWCSSNCVTTVQFSVIQTW
jgi:hypothetical protein